ncbi:MAG: chaperonin GroEL, partial [Planctomycetota bacterium]
VGSIAANNDRDIGEQIADAMEKVGKDGVITVEEGQGLHTTVDLVEGMQFDRGYLSPHFVTDREEMEVVLEDCYVLLWEKIRAVPERVPLMEQISQQDSPVLIIAEDVEGEALATLVVNKLRGVLQAAAVKAPGFGDRRSAMLEDIAVLTGGQVVTEELGIDLESIGIQDLGKAGKIVIDQDTTTVVEGAGDSDAIQSRIEQIKREIDSTDSDYDREKLEERLARLAGGVAQINVGAATEVEMNEKQHRIEDAVNATRSAVEEGIVPGGGVALLRCLGALDDVDAEGDEAVGVDIVRKAVRRPLKQIAKNAGQDGSITLERVMEAEGNQGYDAAADEFTDLMERGVIDPAKVVRIALQNGTSVANMLLSTDAVISELDEDEDEGGGHGPHAH